VTWLIVIVVWIVASFPIGLVIGKWLS